MAKVYSPPEELPPPEVDYRNYDSVKHDADEDAWLHKLAELCKRSNKGDTVGKEVRTPQGDGYARYMVFREKPLTLLHLPLGDAWHADAVWLRGLRLPDVRRMVARDIEMSKLFGTNDQDHPPAKP